MDLWPQLYVVYDLTTWRQSDSNMILCMYGICIIGGAATESKTESNTRPICGSSLQMDAFEETYPSWDFEYIRFESLAVGEELMNNVPKNLGAGKK